MYRKIRRELSMKKYDSRALLVCWQSLKKLLYPFLNSHTNSPKQTREIMCTKKKSSSKKERRRRRKVHVWGNFSFFAGWLGSLSREEKKGKKAQGIDRSKEMHTQGEFYLNNQPQFPPGEFFFLIHFFALSAREKWNLKFGDGLRWRAKTH